MAPRKTSDDKMPAESASFATTSKEYNGFVYLSMLFLGIGLLTPWNVVLNSIPYLKSNYSGSDADNLAFYLTCAYTYPGLPILVLMVKYGSRINLSWRILGSLVAQAVIMAAMPLVAPYSIWGPLTLMFLNGLCTMVLQSSLFGLASQFPSIFNQGMMSGQGVAGIIASLSSILVMAVSAGSSNSGNDTQKISAIVYFIFAALLLLACAVFYVLLLRNKFAQQYLKPVEGVAGARHAHGDEDDVESAVNGSGRVANDVDDGGDSPLLASSTPSSPSAWGVLKKMWPMALSVHLVFLMTFIVFPGVMDQIPYRGDLGASLDLPALAANGNAWWSTILLATFNICDTIGRTLPARLICVKERWLLPVTLIRFGLIALFLGCANGWGSAFNDATAIAVMIVFSVTNGYFASLSFMFQPSKLLPAERETGGFLMSLFLNMGIVFGSQVALAFKN